MVSTPVGNVEDVTRRALRVLEEVDVVLAEDTRDSGRLLTMLGVKARLRAYHDHTSDESRERIVKELREGLTMALISDAGTPTLSDPGYSLIRDARAAGVAVVPVPGASALLAFLAAAGLPTDRFQFVGFAPRRGGARAKAVAEWLRYSGTTVCYESPHRVVDLLRAVADVAPSTSVVLGRELTKRFEEFVCGDAREVLAALVDRESVKGEIVVGLVGAASVTSDDEVDGWIRALLAAGLRTKVASRVVADRLGVSKSDVYQRALRLEREGEEDPSP